MVLLGNYVGGNADTDAEIKNILGVDSARNESVSVGASNVQVSDMKPRKAVYLRNTSTGGQILTISLGDNPAVAGAGIVLNAGESFIDSDSEGYKSWKGRIQAISSAVGGTLAVMER